MIYFNVNNMNFNITNLANKKVRQSRRYAQHYMALVINSTRENVSNGNEIML